MYDYNYWWTEVQKTNIPGTPTSTNVFLRHFCFDMFKKSLLSLCLFLFLHLHSNVFSRKALICIFDACLILQETNSAKEVKKGQIPHRFPGNSDEGRHDTMTSFCQRKRNNNCEQHLVILDRVWSVENLCREICMKRVTHVYDTQVCKIYKCAQWFVCDLWVHTNVCFNSHTKKNNFTNVSIQTWCTHLK